ncbi:MAG: methyltransferase domain-containing protein, partial [Planctomyces sp.]
AGVHPGDVVLDLGCGPGHATMDLAQIVGPEGLVIALDENRNAVRARDPRARGRPGGVRSGRASPRPESRRGPGCVESAVFRP